MVCSFVTNDLSFRFKVAASRLCWEKCREEKVSQQPVYTKPMYCSFCGKLDGSEVKNPPANEGDSRSIPGSGRSPGEGNATHSSMLAWNIPRAEEPGGPPFTGVTKSQTQLSDWAHRHHGWGDRTVGRRSECAFSWGLKNPCKRLLRKAVCCSSWGCVDV